ncbi:MAG: hypothetical protein QNK04_06875 [Myxococcota bacterium]|nr:hypothetical protein [Myxococcota bacterium]
MITGFNTNVRYGGRVYHVQTEDSGRSHPHVITHVYHGGTILASEKVEYAEQLGEEDLTGFVRNLMEQQHKLMLDRLKGGEFDSLIGERIGESSGADGEADSAPAAEDEKPLDEMILEYLVKKARDRATSRPGRNPRSRE